jgi:hypothetical protein
LLVGEIDKAKLKAQGHLRFGKIGPRFYAAVPRHSPQSFFTVCCHQEFVDFYS